MEIKTVKRTTVTFSSEDILHLVNKAAEVTTDVSMEEAKVYYTKRGEIDYSLEEVGIELIVEGI